MKVLTFNKKVEIIQTTVTELFEVCNFKLNTSQLDLFAKSIAIDLEIKEIQND